MRGKTGGGSARMDITEMDVVIDVCLLSCVLTGKKEGMERGV